MKTTILFLFVIISLSCYAQDGKKWEHIPMSTLTVGMSFQKFEGLNSCIADHPQYEGLRDNTGTLQLGFLKERNRVVSDFGIMGGSSMSGDRDTKSSTLHFIGINAGIGYDVIKSDRIMLYPIVGLGLEKYQAKFYKDNSGVAFEDVLQTPSIKNTIQPVDFKNSFFNYRVGFGVAFKKSATSPCAIGLQAGYTGSFEDHTWKSGDNQSLAGAPSDKLSRFYVGLVFASQPMCMKH